MAEIEKIKILREETGISISECKKALTEANFDLEKARQILKEKYGVLAKKMEKREAKEGIVDAYIHSSKKIGAMVKLKCESDFVARSPDFQKLAHELCLQIVAIDPKEIPLLEQKWIRDETKTIEALINEYSAKFGEKVIVEDYCRFQI
ncbi:elongation factor Ts [Candidatus Parcubacteria bacterium]|nr:elongation factor Ts [Candidatus Parcubacteria bacterium]